MQSKELQAIMNQYTGTENYYKLQNLTITDGVQAFAENAEAWWFVSDMNLFLKYIYKADPAESLFSIHLEVENNKATLKVKNGKGHIVFKRLYSFTDCPEGEWIFYLYRNNSVLIWNKEY